MRKFSAVGLALVFIIFFSSSCAQKPSFPQAGSAKAIDMLTLVPKDAKGIFIVNFHRAMETEPAQKAIKEDENYKKYQQVIAQTGIDPQKDLYFIAGALTGQIRPTQQEGVILLNLKYNKESLQNMIKKAETMFQEEVYNGITIYGASGTETKGPASGAFIDDSNIALGSKEAVKAVIDVYQKKTDNVLKSKELSALIKNANKDALFWSALIFPPETIQQLAAQNPMLKSLEGIKSLLIYFDYLNKSILAEIKAIGGDETKNKQLAALLNGFKVGGTLVSTKDQNVADLMNRIEITSGSDYLRIYANIPEDLLKNLGEKMKSSKKGESN